MSWRVLGGVAVLALVSAVFALVVGYSIGSAIGLLLSAPQSSSYGLHQVGPLLIGLDTCTGLHSYGVTLTQLGPDWYQLKVDCPY